MLFSTSDDYTICCWNPTVPWGRDDQIVQGLKRDGEKLNWDRVQRPFVPGELLAKLARGGHSEGVLHCVSPPSPHQDCRD